MKRTQRPAGHDEGPLCPAAWARELFPATGRDRQGRARPRSTRGPRSRETGRLPSDRARRAGRHTGAEGPGIQARQEIHSEPVGELFRAVEAERLVDRHVWREQRSRREGKSRRPERAPAHQAPAERAGLEKRAAQADRDQQEAIRERIVEGRGSGPTARAPAGTGRASACPPESGATPRDSPEEEAHLHDRAVEMLEAVRIEGKDHPGQQARDRPAGDRPRQGRGEEATAQAQGQEHRRRWWRGERRRWPP